jgi:hypothetical protein
LLALVAVGLVWEVTRLVEHIARSEWAQAFYRLLYAVAVLVLGIVSYRIRIAGERRSKLREPHPDSN